MAKKNILFIDPPGAYAKIVNTGLGYIASSLNKHSDCNFKVIDLNNVRKNRDKVMTDAFSGCEVDAVGVSLNVGSMHAMPALLSKIKNYFPGSKVFIGGPHVTLHYKKLLMDFAQFVDFAVVRETERTISKIIDNIHDKEALSDIPGVVLKEGLDKNIFGETIDDIDTIDFPSYECFESVKRNNCSMEYYPIITSRGCPYSCIFCAGPKISGKKWRFRNPESVVDEIEFALKRYKTRNLEIFDDNFLLDKKRAVNIMEMILKRNIKMRLRFGNGVRADKLDEENVKLMKAAGLYEVGMGIESADPDIFRNIKKGEGFEAIEKAIGLLKKYDIHMGGSFIIGLPGATLAKDINSIKFANRMGFSWRYTAWCYFTPYPSTEAYDMIRKEVDEETIEKSHRRGHFTANFIETKDYPLEERIIVRSIAAKIPPVHPGYSKRKLLKLFLKTEATILKNRDKNLSFLKFNFLMLERMFYFMKLWVTNKVNPEAYL
ncbi:MAG: radical SAM protein [Candidatus Ratteibacteria bacterium]|nr:radical SAM protein [Candidatus Ratteibacteria bacterium]